MEVRTCRPVRLTGSRPAHPQHGRQGPASVTSWPAVPDLDGQSAPPSTTRHSEGAAYPQVRPGHHAPVANAHDAGGTVLGARDKQAVGAWPRQTSKDDRPDKLTDC